jgi:hypothetical protein
MKFRITERNTLEAVNDEARKYLEEKGRTDNKISREELRESSLDFLANIEII